MLLQTSSSAGAQQSDCSRVSPHHGSPCGAQSSRGNTGAQGAAPAEAARLGCVTRVTLLHAMTLPGGSWGKLGQWHAAVMRVIPLYQPFPFL